MKKTVITLIVFILAVLLCSCKKEPAVGVPQNGGVTVGETEVRETETAAAETETALKVQIKNIADNNALIGVSYLGFREDNSEKLTEFLKRQKYWNDAVYLLEVDPEAYVESAGAEVYVVIPAEGVSVTVYEFVMDAEDGKTGKGEVLYSDKKGEPFYLQGNVSDIIPSFVIAAEKDGVSVEYSPCLSLRDGRLSTPEKSVYDMTPYKSMTDFIYSEGE